MNQKKNRRAAILVALLVIVLLLAVSLFFLLRTKDHPEPENRPLQADPNVKVGTLQENPEERQKELEQMVEEGMITFSINATPVLSDGQSKANLMIENPSENGNRFTVQIFRRDSGEKIYESGYLDPGQYIDEVALDVSLAAGEYPCTAYFTAYQIADNSYIGRAGAELTLYVLN